MPESLDTTIRIQCSDDDDVDYDTKTLKQNLCT